MDNLWRMRGDFQRLASIIERSREVMGVVLMPFG